MKDARRSEDLVHSYLLERRARETPDRLFARFPLENDLRWNWRHGDDEANKAANFLRELGVRQRDVVAMMHEPDSQFLRFFLGALRLGAVVSPLNEAFTGYFLKHTLEVSAAKVFLCSGAWADRLVAIECTHLETVILSGTVAPSVRAALAKRFRLVEAADVVNASFDRPVVDPIGYWDPYAVIYTSGTTGPSKAALSPYGQIHAVLKENYLKWLGPDDIFLSDAPLFHITGLLAIYVSLFTGAAFIRYPRFSASEYWDRIDECGATATTLTRIDFTWRTPPRPGEGRTTLRWMLTGQLPPYTDEWRKRFGVGNVFTFFNSSELCAPLHGTPNPANLMTCGKVRDGVEVRLVDAHDLEVPPGEVGELVVRTELPWEMAIEYLNNPAATATAWRNGWFHTGDLFRCDGEGWYYYIDRLKDSIRRKGENISSLEVELVVMTHPAIFECAVVGAPSDIPGSDEVRLVAVLKPDQSLSAPELAAFLEGCLPKFMWPRYIEFTDVLPRNPTHKILKKELRERGLGPGTWDRQAALSTIA